MAAARERLHAIARELPRDHAPHFEEETQGRIDGAIARYSPHHREAYAEHEAYEEEEQYEEDEPLDAQTSLRNEVFAPDVPASYYPPSDSYANGSDDEPASYDEPVSEAPAPRHDRANSYPGTDDSGARERPEPAVEYDNEAYETSYPGVDRRGIARHEPVREVREASYRRHESDLPVGHDDDSQSRRREDPRREERQQDRQAPLPTRREDSSAQREEDAAVVTEMKIPANFVVGVQPIRQPVSFAPITPSFPHPPIAAHAMTQPPAAGTMAASPRAMQAGQQQAMVSQAVQLQNPMQAQMQAQLQNQMQAQMQAQAHVHQSQPPAQMPAQMAMPQMMPQPGMMGPGILPGQRAPTGSRPVTGPRTAPAAAQPVGHQLQTTAVEEATQGSKVGRFAWFVFGAAFGIFFAFFATGFVPHIGKKDEIVFPPVAQVPAAAQTATAPAPQPTVAATVSAGPTFAPVAPTMTAAPTMYAPTAAPVQTSAAPMMAAAPTAAPTTTYAPAPPPVQRTTPAPRSQRATPGPRRAAMRSVNGDDERPAPKPSSESAGDLLNAGLGN